MSIEQQQNEHPPLPLKGVRIVECGVWHAGPGAAAILGDLGAEVIKVESLAGEPERRQRTLGSVPLGGTEDDWSLLYEISNRSKRGICVDLESGEGSEILRRLVASADVFLTNFKEKTVARLKVDYPTVSTINPRIIHVTVSGYGPNGPLAHTGGFDPMGQAVSGMSLMAGSGEPQILQVVILDQVTAITASHAVLTALYQRKETGKGQAIHASLYGSGVWLLYANLLTASYLKQNISTTWDRKTAPALRNTYKCRDGNWIVGTNHPEHKYWPTFCKLLDVEWMNGDARFATPEARARNMAELIAAIDEIIVGKTRAEWLDLFTREGLQFVPVNTYEDVLHDPQALANGYIVEANHPMMGSLRMPGYPVRFSGASTRSTPAPTRGQHTADVLQELGFEPHQIEVMRKSGRIRCA